jgi:N-acetylmuramoyl-L-alanine amidase
MIALIPGHLGKPQPDPGACLDLDGDGLISPGETEAIRNLYLATAILEGITSTGKQAVILSDGTYAERTARALARRASLVVHVHHDSGHGGMVLYDHRSTRGRATALKVAQAASSAWCACRALPCHDDRAEAGDRAWLYRSFGLISGLYPTAAHGIVVECLSMRNAFDPQYIRTLGLAIGRALE